MKSVPTLIGLLVMIAGGSWWALNGAHTGWTKTSVAVEKVDEITEISYVEYEDRLVPGIEFPVAFAGAGIALIGLGWWLGRKRRI
jgi:LPXTG-motif cell wall-anchored protein